MLNLWYYKAVTKGKPKDSAGQAGQAAAAQEDITMAKKFYAVQIGSDFSSDWGSTRKHEAIVMAHRAARENPGKEIRISVCREDDDYCEREIIIREGSRT